MTEVKSQCSTENDNADVEVNARGVEGTERSLDHSPLTQQQPDISSRDWDCLFTAVTERLRSTVGERLGAEHAAQIRDTESWVKASVLECSDALDQLHASLSHERLRCQQLEAEVLNAQRALALALEELAGTQEGERRARRLALHDGLTALPNRSFFRWRLDHALNHTELPRQMLAVLYLDLDSFKPINDAHGHGAGDELLRIVAERITDSVRTEDMVSRMGGDEFACLLAGTQTREKLSRLAGDLLNAVSEPFTIGDIEVTVRPTIGIAISPTDGDTAETLLKNADVAMYSAKRRRSGYAFFSDCAAT